MKVEPVSRIKAHQSYYVDGVRVPGVTTVTGILDKPALVRWANQMGLKGIDTSAYVSKVADAGTLAHMMIAAHWCGSHLTQDDLDGFTMEQQRLADNAFLSYLEWEKGKKIEVLNRPRPDAPLVEDRCVEMQLVSYEYHYGGTLDCLPVINGELTILDLKTSRSIYEEHLYQVAAYWQLAKENGWEADAIRILQIGRGEDEDWSEKIIRQPKLEKYWNVFRCCLETYRALKEARG